MSLLDRIERAGNSLPDPATLFLGGAIVVMLLSHLAVVADWEVTKSVTQGDHQIEQVVRATSLLTAAGAYWAVKSLVANFKDFPPSPSSWSACWESGSPIGRASSAHS